MSTSYHPETDGQTERANRTIQQMLRAISGYHMSSWENFLGLLEFAYNNHESASTKFSPFYINYGYNPRVPATLLQHTAQTANEAVNEQLTIISSTVKMAQDNIILAQQKQAKYADQHRNEQEFNIGDLVLLSTRNIKLKNLPSETKRSG